PANIETSRLQASASADACATGQVSRVLPPVLGLYLPAMLDVFRSRKMAALTLLGFSSGVPLYLSQRTLQAWLTTAGVDLSTIGFFSLIGLPYSLKFLWSPFVDRYALPLFGRRRGWILLTQAGLAVTIALASAAKPQLNLQYVA